MRLWCGGQPLDSGRGAIPLTKFPRERIIVGPRARLGAVVLSGDGTEVSVENVHRSSLVDTRYDGFAGALLDVPASLTRCCESRIDASAKRTADAARKFTKLVGIAV